MLEDIDLSEIELTIKDLNNSNQFKGEDFQNNDGTGSQMGRWTREEHEKFILGK
jgi:hypothetical protein